MNKNCVIEVKVCMSTACHLKGAGDIAEKLQQLIKQYDLKDCVELGGMFCFEKCDKKGVNVSVDGKTFDVTMEEVEKWFQNEILKKVVK